MYKPALNLRKIQIIVLKKVVVLSLLAILVGVGWVSRLHSLPSHKAPVTDEASMATGTIKQTWPPMFDASPQLKVVKVFSLGDRRPIPVISAATHGEWPIEGDSSELQRAMTDDFRPQLRLKRAFTIGGQRPLGSPLAVMGRIAVWQGTTRYLVLDLEVILTWPGAHRH